MNEKEVNTNSVGKVCKNNEFNPIVVTVFIVIIIFLSICLVFWAIKDKEKKELERSNNTVEIITKMLISEAFQKNMTFDEKKYNVYQKLKLKEKDRTIHIKNVIKLSGETFLVIAPEDSRYGSEDIILRLINSNSYTIIYKDFSKEQRENIKGYINQENFPGFIIKDMSSYPDSKEISFNLTKQENNN